MISVPLYAQQDARWANLTLGETELTMGRMGCFVTALTMMLNNFAIYLTPKEVLEKLNEKDAFTETGLLIHAKIVEAFPEVFLHERVYTTNVKDNRSKMHVQAAINKIDRRLKMGLPSILHVDNIGNDQKPDHMVLLVDYGLNDEWVIHDPDLGQKTLFKKRYGDPLTGLYGYMSIIGSSLSAPDDGDIRLGHAVYKQKRGLKETGKHHFYLDEVVGHLMG